MSIANMLSLWEWLALAAIPPAIVLLYFLKLKRQPLEVPSTYLWAKSIEDLHVNSIWQRLRRNLLLLLQLLFVAALMLAALRFGWRGSQLSGARFVFLVDNSASMASVDVVPSRLADAKRRVGELIDQMKSGDQAMIISFSDTARVEQPFTDNRPELRQSLAAIDQTRRGTSLDEALRLAAGYANPGAATGSGSTATPPTSPATASIEPAAAPIEPAEGPTDPTPAPVVPAAKSAGADQPPATVYLFSDGKFPDIKTVSLGSLAPPVFVPIGDPGAANIAITAFSAKRPDAKPEVMQVFGRLENFGASDAAVELELLRDGSLVDASQLTIKANSSLGATFELADIDEGVLELVARPGGKLNLDDRAWAVVAAAERTNVLLATPGDTGLERALSSASDLADVRIVAPDYLQSPEYLAAAAGGVYDLIVYDLCQPKTPPAANTLFIGAVPPGEGWLAGERIAAPQVIDVNAAHPITQFVDLGDVIFASARPLKPPPGSRTLIESNQGILFAVSQREGWKDAVLGAEIVIRDAQGDLEPNTDWPIRLSFVVMLRNALGYLGHQQASSNDDAMAPGRVVAWQAEPGAEAVSVKTPSGKQAPVTPNRFGAFAFHDSGETGVYEVLTGSAVRSRFAINLFDLAESDIRPRLDRPIKAGAVEIAAQSHWEGVRREVWKPLVILALGLLILEWYIYNRRVYI